MTGISGTGSGDVEDPMTENLDASGNQIQNLGDITDNGSPIIDTSEIATDAVDTNEINTSAVTGNEVTFSAFFKVAEVSTDTTMDPGGHYFVDASGGNVTMTLPSPLDGNRATVKKISGSGNDVIVARPSGNPIDTASADDTISNQFTVRTYIFNSSNWWVI